MRLSHYFKSLSPVMVLALFCLVILAPTVSFAADITQPEEFYGNVTVNGLPAPTGSVIIAKIGGVERGRLTTTVAGQYGGSGTFTTRLVVSGQQADIGQTVNFYINNNKANQTANFTPGQSVQLALSAQSYPLNTGDTPITKALAYLRQAQQSNGSIGGFVASSWVVMAVAAAGQDPHTWTAGSNSLVTYLRDNASANLDPNKATDWERSILAIVAAGENPHSFGGIDYVTKLLSFYDGTQMGDSALLNDDCWGILALKGIGEGSQMIPNIAGFIKSKQNSDGGWSWTVGGASDADDTAAAISALAAAGESTSSQSLTNAINYLKSQQQSNGGFVSEGTTNSAVDAWTIRAIRDLGQSPTADQWQNTGNNPVGHLLSLQDTDGVFKWTLAQRSNPEWMTAYAIPALLGTSWPKDTLPPVISNLIPVSGSSISTTNLVISASYADTISGINPSTAKLYLDSIDVSGSASITASGISYNASNLNAGTHTVRVSVSDKAGNSASQNWTFRVVITNSGGGGGGGSGGVTTPTPTPTPSPSTLPLGTTDVTGIVDNNGVFSQDMNVQSQDAKCILNIGRGIKALTGDNRPLGQVSVISLANAPAPPAQSNVVGLAYDCGPSGATFEPPITLTFKYDVSQLPQGVTEKSLVMATWDSSASRWVELESTLDPQTKTITAKVSHFCVFSVLTHTRPANITLSNLSVSPTEIATQESVNISAIISNTGDVRGAYAVNLKVDNALVQTKQIILDGGDQTTVSFSLTGDAEGTHTVSIGSLSGTYTVKTPTIPVALVINSPEITPGNGNEAPKGAVSEQSKPETSLVNWFLIGDIVAGVLVVGLLILFFRRRRA